MNAQNAQNLHNCLTSEMSYICKSSTERLLGRVFNLINSIRNYYANQALAGRYMKMSPRLLRDIGLDDPQIQMRLFDRNFNAESDLRELGRNRFPLQ